MDARFSSCNRDVPDFTAQTTSMDVDSSRAAAHDLGHRARAIRTAASRRPTPLPCGGSGGSRGDVSSRKSHQRRACRPASPRAENCAESSPGFDLQINARPTTSHWIDCRTGDTVSVTLTADPRSFVPDWLAGDRPFHCAVAAARHRDLAEAVSESFLWTAITATGRFFG